VFPEGNHWSQLSSSFSEILQNNYDGQSLQKWKLKISNIIYFYLLQLCWIQLYLCINTVTKTLCLNSKQ
jgi:hypothetical protein